jgi:hypothetical protein
MQRRHSTPWICGLDPVAGRIRCLPRDGVDTLPINFGPINMEATAVFKIRGGKIHEIEAMGFLLPYGSKTGWE